MKNNIFYSWQSDLPNNTNRGFIGECIEGAIKKLNKSEQYQVEFCIDRDTMNERGTPNIANSIFNKIEKSILFVADVSIINADYEKRKSPNPNVLIELGYAAKVLGWEKIICIFNKDYGEFEDLPFDIRFRRPLCYSLKDTDKSKVKEMMIEAIKSNIESFDTNDLVSLNDIGTYLIFEANSSDLENNIINIFKDNNFQSKYGFTDNDFYIDNSDDFEYRFNNNEPYSETDIEHFIFVIFKDDTYSNGNDSNNECSIFFSMKEKFKQINFSNNKVYSVFEIISHGYSPSGKGRKYSEISDELIKKP